ncbi:MAG: hypothetical protein AAF252_03975 [Pseudomonadota bacterium]
MQLSRPELWLVLSVLVVGLSACASTSTTSASKRVSEHGYVFPTIEKAFENSLTGRTLFFSNDGHGTQVEYFADNGRAYLWYRGNRTAVSSRWRTASPETGDIPGPPIPIGRGDVAICFKYPSASYNPVTKTSGGAWECRASILFGENVVAIVEGDPFDLASGQLPAVMPKNSTMSVEEILTLTPAAENLNYIWKR